MLTVVNVDGTFSGVQYDEVKQKYINHHHKYGQKLIWLDRKLELDEEGSVLELPLEEDLENEITKAPESVTELKNRLEATEQALLQLMMEEM